LTRDGLKLLVLSRGFTNPICINTAKYWYWIDKLLVYWIDID